MVSSVPGAGRQVSGLPGAQVVARVGRLLRIVSAAPAGGLSTSEVVAESGLTRATAHRLLSALAVEGLLDQDPRTGRWSAGPELYLMGAVAAGRYDVTHLGRDLVRSLSAQTGESAFLSARRGDETVCLVREEGSFPIRSHVLHEGIRFPLGIASAGLAVLAFLPEQEVEAYLRRHRDLGVVWGARHEEGELRRRLAETRARGYAVNPGLLVEGSWGMAAVVLDARGEPGWALSLTGVEFRFGPERRTAFGTTLLEHAHELSRRIVRGGLPPNPPR